MPMLHAILTVFKRKDSVNTSGEIRVQGKGVGTGLCLFRATVSAECTELSGVSLSVALFFTLHIMTFISVL